MRIRMMLAGAALLGGVGTAQANLLVNGGFEAPVLASTTLNFNVGDAVGAWTVIGNTPGATGVMILRTDYAEGGLLFTAQEGQQSVDMTGPFNQGADKGVEQSVATTAGLQYVLSFWVGNQNNSLGSYPLNSSVLLKVAGSSVGSFTNSDNTVNNVNWQQFSTTFTATGSITTIAFLNNVASNENYVGLDNVSLVLAAAPPTGVPEPLSAGLLGAWLLGLGLARRARR